MKILIDNNEIIIKEPKRVCQLIKNDDRKIIACIVDNRLKDLNYIVEDDCNIELVTLNSPDGMWVYQSTLRYVICMAVKNLFPDAKIKISYSVSRTFYAALSNLPKQYSVATFNKIKAEVDRIIKEDYPLVITKVSKSEAIKIYKEEGYFDKIDAIQTRKKQTLHIYRCEDYYNHVFEFLMPSTGYLKSYKLSFFGNGFNISYPRYELDEKLPKFQEEITFREVLRECAKWSHIARANSVADLNKIITENKHLDLINLCETRHNRDLTILGNKIENNIDKIKLICVAGPSSSGKTTFTSRLRIELQSRGYEPLMISIDNFYKTKNYPKDKNGQDDYEHIKALDIKLFDQCISSLIAGNEVKLPIFVFGTHERLFTEPIKLKKNQPILIEGIHALNPMLTPSIMPENKFTIFISPITTTRIDDHSPISSTDIRLLRRIVRDNATRKTKCNETLNQWASVRAGEFKWIFPYQDYADFVYNSDLSYEICVTANLAMPLLKEIKRDSPNYNLARRLIKIINYFPQMEPDYIPCNSILREFIGGSIFYPKDKR